jgi:c(7)-type cytochrome triheme protein
VSRGAAALLLALVAWPAGAERPVFPEHASPDRYGTVVLERAAAAAGMAPVAFEHWRHRLLYSCRLCHVDVGFAMQAGGTQITAEANRSGLYCGACHDGTYRHAGTVVFAACGERGAGPPDPACGRCHGPPFRAERRAAYLAFARRQPLAAGDLVDWEEAERRLFDPPADFVEGISLRSGRLSVDRNFSVAPIGTWLGEVAFSHQKHARWSGCEGCHPEIFPSTRRGGVTFRMKDIARGEFCGACHNRVAFPIAACLRCHQRPPR